MKLKLLNQKRMKCCVIQYVIQCDAMRYWKHLVKKTDCLVHEKSSVESTTGLSAWSELCITAASHFHAQELPKQLYLVS